MTHPWDKQEGEPDLWFDRFDRLFRSQGPSRTMDGAYRAEKGKKGSAPGRWHTEANKWHWWERAAAWDEHQRQKAHAIEESEIEQRRKAWINQIMALQGVGTQGLLKLQEMLESADEDSPLSPRDVLAFITEGIRQEMLVRGQATEINKHEHSGTVSLDDKRTELAQLIASLRDRAATSRN